MKPPPPMTKKRIREPMPPELRFSPYAWAKWQFLRDRGPTEIGGFGISAPDDLLLVEDFLLLPQLTTTVTVAFDDAAVAEFFDRQVDLGRQPEQFARIWLHTHPGNSADPSSPDEETFDRVFGNCSWAVMGILARGGETYARFRCQSAIALAAEIAVSVDFGEAFPGSDQAAWADEYDACVTVKDEFADPQPSRRRLRHLAAAGHELEFDTLDGPFGDQFAESCLEGRHYGDDEPL
jgi:hypothetical protein